MEKTMRLLKMKKSLKNTVKKILCRQVICMIMTVTYDHKKEVVKDGVFPQEVLDGARNYRKQCEGIKPAFNVWSHICVSI